MRAPIVAAAILLSACAADGGGSLGDGEGRNYAAASPLGAGIAEKDARALGVAFLQAVEKGAPGERFDWRAGTAFGWVKAEEERVGNLKTDQSAPPVAEGVDLSETYETEQGLFALTRNANVRLGPSTDFPSREQLVSGTGVKVIGKVVGKPWMLVEVGGRVAGYIHEDLMIRAPGTEIGLAGGPRRKATRCRGYEQRLSVGGKSDQWEGLACKEDGRWALRGPSADDPAILF